MKILNKSTGDIILRTLHLIYEKPRNFDVIDEMYSTKCDRYS